MTKMESFIDGKINNKGNELSYMSRDISSAIKGIAILMMYVHHFFTFPDYWVNGLSYPALESVSSIISPTTKFCVSIFTFITGYVYFFNMQKNYRYSLKKIRNFLIQYWGAYLLIGMIDAIWGNYKFTLKGILLEIFAIKRPIMFFCWYVYFYIFSMLIMPLYAKLFKKTGTTKKGLCIDFAIIAIVVPACFGLLRFVLPFTSINQKYLLKVDEFAFLICNIAGFLCAKYNLYRKLDVFCKKSIKSRKVMLAIWGTLLLLVPFGKYFQTKLPVKYDFDYVLAFIFIYCATNLLMQARKSILFSIIGILGKYSLQMWFVHCFFFNACKEQYQMILYWPYNPLLVLIWGTLICLVVSVFLDRICKKIILGWDKLIEMHKHVIVTN